ncbi:DoxX family protein [Aestuariibacter sp. AA17]|uniref:DoxX family protein n=1 Tax=Fluctibacter corallii TaxID=2984329 RepID=A0ABT3AAH4_9ALTE|nr:DoxX family protein [Aestuariibacter sp. AA17]MCV2885671.1 DoxX family protein [Aestuariibacter sp. AA17]
MYINKLHTLIHPGQGIAPVLLRGVLGITFVAHGAQKLFGWFGGYGLEATGQWMASIGLEPGWFMAFAAGSAEFFGGLFLLLGLLTRLSGAALAVTMLVAIFSVHIGNGFFMAANGYEFGLVLMVASLSLVLSGAGKYSVDQWLYRVARK